MKKWAIVFVILIGLNLMGCADIAMVGEKPPKVSIEVGNELYETTLGSYCWNGWMNSTCADTAGPIDLLKDTKPIKVKPGEKISFVMNYEPKPSEMDVVQFHENKESKIELTENKITAPTQKGIYYYAYSVWWQDEKDPNVSQGDAFYAFVIEVE